MELVKTTKLHTIDLTEDELNELWNIVGFYITSNEKVHKNFAERFDALATRILEND